MTSITTLSRVCESLEKYVYDRVWNEPYTEFRTYAWPKALNTVAAGGHFIGRYGTILLPPERTFSLTKDTVFASDKTYYTLSSVGMYVPAEVTVGEAVPRYTYYELDVEDYAVWMEKSRAKYYGFAVSSLMFDTFKINVHTWTPLSDYCNKNFPDLQLFTRSGIFLNKGKTFIRPSDNGQFMFLAAESDMFERTVGELGKIRSFDKTVDYHKDYYLSRGSNLFSNALVLASRGKQEVTAYKAGETYYRKCDAISAYILVEVKGEVQFATKLATYKKLYVNVFDGSASRELDPGCWNEGEASDSFTFKTNGVYFENDEVIFGKYFDSDGVADNQVNAFPITETIVAQLNKTPATTTYGIDKATYNLYNGRLVTGDFERYRRYFKAGDYFESVIDEDVVGDFIVPCNDRTNYVVDNFGQYKPDEAYFVKQKDGTYKAIEINSIAEYMAAVDKWMTLYWQRQDVKPSYIDNNGEEKILIHIPLSTNPDYYIITPQTCDLWLVPKVLGAGAKVTNPRPEFNGIYLYPCGNQDQYVQIGHNDFAVKAEYIAQIAAEHGFDDYDIRVLVRHHNKMKVCVRDSNFIDLLYTLEDEDVVKFLLGKHEYQTEKGKLLFWQAKHLEQKPYAQALVRRRATRSNQPITIEHDDGKHVQINLQCQTCALRSQCSLAPKPLEKRVAAYSTYFYRVDAVTGTWDFVSGINTDEAFMQARALHGDLYCGEKFEVPCNYYTTRNIQDYVQILGYFHVLGLIGRRVSHFQVTVDGSNTVQVKAPLGLSTTEMAATDYYPLVYHNGVRVDQDRVNVTDSAAATPGVKELYHEDDSLRGTDEIPSQFSTPLRITINPTYSKSKDRRLSKDKPYYRLGDDGIYHLLHGISQKDWDLMIDRDGNPLPGRKDYDYIYGRYLSEYRYFRTTHEKFQAGVVYKAIPIENAARKFYDETTDIWFDGHIEKLDPDQRTTYYKRVETGATTEPYRYIKLVGGTYEQYKKHEVDYYYPYTTKPSSKSPILKMHRMAIAEFGEPVYEYLNLVPRGDVIDLRPDYEYKVGDSIADWEEAHAERFLKVVTEFADDQGFYVEDDPFYMNDTICVELLDNRRSSMDPTLFTWAGAGNEYTIPTPLTSLDQWRVYSVGTMSAQPGYRTYTRIPESDLSLNTLTKQVTVTNPAWKGKLLLVEGPQVVTDSKDFDIDQNTFGYIGKGAIPRSDSGCEDYPHDGEIVFLNGKRLVGGLDYATDGYETTGAAHGSEIYIQNLSYLREKNKVDVIRNDSSTVSRSHGFLNGNVISWPGSDPYWSTELSLLTVDGKVVSYFRYKLGALTISDYARFADGTLIYRNGAPYEIRSCVSTRVHDIIGCPEEEAADKQKTVEIAEYFNGADRPPVPDRRSIIPHSHKIYSIYLEEIMNAYFTGNFDFDVFRALTTYSHPHPFPDEDGKDYYYKLTPAGDYYKVTKAERKEGMKPGVQYYTPLTEKEFGTQFTAFEWLKERDVIFNLSETDRNYVDFYPHYHRVVANNREAYVKLHYLYTTLLPTDPIKHKDAPHE